MDKQALMDAYASMGSREDFFDVIYMAALIGLDQSRHAQDGADDFWYHHIQGIVSMFPDLYIGWQARFANYPNPKPPTEMFNLTIKEVD